MRTRRYCSRFYCDHFGERFCCTDCLRKMACKNPCWNDPSRCGLEDRDREHTPKKGKDVYTVSDSDTYLE